MRDFQAICRDPISLQDASTLKIWTDLLKGYRVMRVLSRGLVFPKFSAPPSGETMRRTPKVLEVQLQERLSPCQVWWGSDFTAAGAAKNVEFFVCVSVRHAFERQSSCVRFRHEGAIQYRIDFDALDRERFVVVHPCSIFSDCRQLATP